METFRRGRSRAPVRSVAVILSTGGDPTRFK